MSNVDFTGGDSLVLRSDKPICEAQVRGQLEKLGLGSVVIQQETSVRNQQTVHLISIRAPYGTGQKILSDLKAAPETSGLVIENSETVGPVMGAQLATTSLYALGIAFLGVMIYVAIRFEFSFSVGTIVAMIHDLIITLGIFVLRWTNLRKGNLRHEVVRPKAQPAKA